MKGFIRENQLFSLCGLNCGLCPMHIGGHCGGCGFGNQSCPIAKCSLVQKGVEYCFQCARYPCDRYANTDEYDSFITHQRQMADMEKVQRIGMDAYNTEQTKKIELLSHLQEQYNDGRKKTLFCLAVNLLELNVLEAIISKADAKTQGLPIKEKSAFIAQLIQQCANEHGIELRLKKRKDG